MSKVSEILNQLDEGGPPIFEPVLKEINWLVEIGALTNFAVGGSVALMFYAEAQATKDIDIVCIIPRKGVLYDLGPILRPLLDRGFKMNGQHVLIHGVKVEFLPPSSPIAEEALTTAIEDTIGETKTKVYQYEYAIVEKARVGRDSDWQNISVAINSQQPDWQKLTGLLTKFGLLEKWRQKYPDGQI